jgi:hypothetical protein
MSLEQFERTHSRKGSNVDIRGLFTAKANISQHPEQSNIGKRSSVSGSESIIIDLPPGNDRLVDMELGVFFNRQVEFILPI